MIIKIIFSVAAFLIVICSVWSNLEYDKECRERMEKMKAAWERKQYPKWELPKYLGRMEQAALEILEHQEPVDQTIILWWGLDGLKLTENGELKWISRRKPKPVDTGALRACAQYMGTQNVSQQIGAQMEQMRQQINQPIAQMTAQLDQQINQMRMQMAQNAQNMAMINSLTSPIGYMPMTAPYLPMGYQYPYGSPFVGYNQYRF